MNKKKKMPLKQPIEISNDNYYIETNRFMNYLYAKPQKISYKDNIIGKIKYKIDERQYYKTKIKPVYNKLLNDSPSFNTMYEYADFIRLIERVFFYNNAIDLRGEGEEVDKLICDSDISQLNKILLLDLEKDNVLIVFRLSTRGEDQIIDIQVKYNFGKKSTMNYNIVNREVNYDSVHSENLMITILDRLQNAMAKLFLDYYNKI